MEPHEVQTTELLCIGISSCLIVPMTLIRHYVRLLDIEYLKDQVFLNPHPKELALRNHV